MKLFSEMFFLVVFLSLSTTAYGQYEKPISFFQANCKESYTSLTAEKIRILIYNDQFKKYFQSYGTRIFYDACVSTYELTQIGKQCREEIESFLWNNSLFSKSEYSFITHCSQDESMLHLINHMKKVRLESWEIIRLIKLLILAYIPTHICLIRYVIFALQNNNLLPECEHYLAMNNFSPSTIIDYRGTTLLGFAAYCNWTNLIERFLDLKNYDCSAVVLNGENAFGYKPLSLALFNSHEVPFVLLLQHDGVKTLDDQGCNIIDSNGYSLRSLAQTLNCRPEIFQLLDEYNL